MGPTYVGLARGVCKLLREGATYKRPGQGKYNYNVLVADTTAAAARSLQQQRGSTRDPLNGGYRAARLHEGIYPAPFLIFTCKKDCILFTPQKLLFSREDPHPNP